MTQPANIGIYGIGVHLPDEVRTNDWWPKEVVDRWREKISAKLDREAERPRDVELEGSRVVLEEMAKLREDPFRGARERRVMPAGWTTSQMEIAAAKQAIARSGVRADEITLLLGTTTVPDHLMVPNVYRVHEALGLPRRCFSLHTEGVCNAFVMQLALAEQMIRGGQARYALLVQSSGTSRIMRQEDPMSCWFGDGATAVVVGPVPPKYGVLGRHHETDGAYYEGVVTGVPGKQWYELGQISAYVLDSDVARRLLLETVHQSKAVIHAALDAAGVTAPEVDFYAAHQGFAWLRPATQRLAGLEHARTFDTFASYASLLGCNVPLVLSAAQERGLLRDGDLVATFSAAAGAALSSTVLRWGRG